MSDDPPGIAVIRRILGERIQRLREQSYMTQEQSARLLQRSRPTLWKIEHGHPQVTIRSRDIAGLCDLYGATEQETAFLIALAGAASVKGWAATLADVLPAGYDLAADMEGGAASISQYADRLIPDLLQTEGYARVVLGQVGDRDNDEAERRVADRMARWGLLTRPDPLRLDVVIAETVLRQVVGGCQVMAYQSARLLALSELVPAAQLRILPAEAGLHHGLITGPFSLLRFGDRGSAVVHTGSPRACFWDRPADIEEFDAAFADISRHALDVERSRERIRAIAAEVAAEGGRPVVHP